MYDFCFAGGEPSRIIAPVFCKRKEKAGLDNVTDFKQAGAANQDKAHGCGTDPQGYEPLPGREAVPAYHLQCRDGQSPCTNQRNLAAAQDVSKTRPPSHYTTSEADGHQAPRGA